MLSQSDTSILEMSTLNPCAAETEYIRFQAYFKKNIDIIKFEEIVSDSKVHQIIKYWRCLFFININIFRHLKLEIALAIPASNDEKYRSKQFSSARVNRQKCFSSVKAGNCDINSSFE